LFFAHTRAAMVVMGSLFQMGRPAGDVMQMIAVDDRRRDPYLPEDPDYPKDPAFRKNFGPRGVLHAWADGRGGQTIENTGPLTKKRMPLRSSEAAQKATRGSLFAFG
jgi:hypothetical protein